MPKKHRMSVLCGQIMLIWFALLMFFMYFVDFASASIIAGFLLLVVAMLLETVAYEEIPIREAVFSEGDSDSATVDKQNEPTPQAKKLHEALNERGVENELEFYDGHKHIDIYILGARLNLEVDGKYHLTDPEFLFRDLQRDLYSHLDGKDTIRIPNSYVDNYLDQIADAIAEVAKRRAKM